MSKVYVGMGSNLNEPIQQLQNALAEIKLFALTELIAVSRFYQTEPVGYKEQPDFINAVCELETNLSPWQLLTALQELELKHGRIRGSERNGPRILDLDILLYADLIIHDEILTIPHPGLYQRLFVLYPLADIAPNLILPNSKSLQDLLRSCQPLKISAINIAKFSI